MNYHLSKSGLRYQDVGHSAGSIIWWVDNAGKVKIFKSTGKEFHHDLNKRMNFDARWRGRLELASGRVSLLPPLKEYKRQPEEIRLPRKLVRILKNVGGTRFFMDTIKDVFFVEI
ncbi:MAG: hypothetical protein PHR77_04700 [Kiritimatiellae bacterium]|nr:hypothetical protein [Kiritimatiellia bacterium]MDD5519473.1 hypothetical protein [Kiritimatiellia bacterium]